MILTINLTTEICGLMGLFFRCWCCERWNSRKDRSGSDGAAICKGDRVRWPRVLQDPSGILDCKNPLNSSAVMQYSVWARGWSEYSRYGLVSGRVGLMVDECVVDERVERYC